MMCENRLAEVLLAAASAPLPQHDENTRRNLKGLKGVRVGISDLGTQAERDGLHMTDIQMDVELKLRLAGIKMLTEAERLETPGAPRLNIGVVAELSTDGRYYIHFVVVKLDQNVRLERDLNERAFGATTWSSAFLVGIWRREDLRRLRDDIKDKVDQFINAYLSVNPK